MTEQAKDSNQLFKNPIGDITGGLMAAIVALPLCLAFGVASELGAQAGIYGAIACGIFAALLGGTAGQCSGPTGPMTVVAAAIYSTNPGRPELVFAATILGGIIQISMGYFKAGQLIGYMPYPVISGFMTGIGAIIICIEISPLFGLPVSGNVVSALNSLPTIQQNWNKDALIIGLLTLAIIHLLPLLTRKLPASLIALVAATVLTHCLNMDVPKIGEIPAGFPQPKLPAATWNDLHVVLQNGLTLAFLGAIDSLLTSLVLDKVTGRRHESDKELIGQGVGNMVAGLFGGLPGAGATMRSMVNVKSGGRTKLSGAMHGIILLAVLLFFGKSAAEIPLAALAAILITVGFNIMDWRVLRSLRRTPKSDAFVMLMVLGLTIFVDLIVAVLAGVALASFLFVKQLTDARVSSFGDLETLEELNELTEHIPESVRRSTFSYVLNGPLFFGEAKNLTESVDKLHSAKYVIIRLLNVPLVDQTGAFALESAMEKWERRGIKVLFVGMQPHIRRTLEDIGAKVSMENCFERFEKAVEAIDLWENGKLHERRVDDGDEK
ncbi:MAG: SulP family inorganic anion transporter [Candidatus Obscuribacterales bacterium]|nr:SulP family inorganic anion transporter [Candidatus Obscuribacterales bacterium]